jgi:hypothetical protein
MQLYGILLIILTHFCVFSPVRQILPVFGLLWPEMFLNYPRFGQNTGSSIRAGPKYLTRSEGNVILPSIALMLSSISNSQSLV